MVKEQQAHPVDKVGLAELVREQQHRDLLVQAQLVFTAVAALVSAVVANQLLVVLEQFASYGLEPHAASQVPVLVVN
jgi:hypothetical protein